MTTESIDLDAIMELKDILEDEFDHLIATYIQDTQDKRDRLSVAVKQQNHRLVRELAHSIKGASINIGILKLGELCQQMESAALDTDSGQYTQVLTDILSEIDTVQALLTEL